MRVYNKNTDKIEILKNSITTSDGTFFTSKIDEETLNKYGYYYIQTLTKPESKYYSYNESRILEDNKYVIKYEPVELDVEIVKERMLESVSTSFKEYTKRPSIMTSLGFPVDASKDDLSNFEIGRDLGLGILKDSNGDVQEVSLEDYATIILEIKQQGLLMYQKKWQKEEEIKSFTTLEECIAYENFVDGTKEVQDELGENIIVDNVINKCIEW